MSSTSSQPTPIATVAAKGGGGGKGEHSTSNATRLRKKQRAQLEEKRRRRKEQVVKVVRERDATISIDNEEREGESCSQDRRGETIATPPAEAIFPSCPTRCLLFLNGGVQSNVEPAKLVELIQDCLDSHLCPGCIVGVDFHFLVDHRSPYAAVYFPPSVGSLTSTEQQPLPLLPTTGTAPSAVTSSSSANAKKEGGTHCDSSIEGSTSCSSYSLSVSRGLKELLDTTGGRTDDSSPYGSGGSENISSSQGFSVGPLQLEYVDPSLVLSALFSEQYSRICLQLQREGTAAELMMEGRHPTPAAGGGAADGQQGRRAKGVVEGEGEGEEEEGQTPSKKKAEAEVQSIQYEKVPGLTILRNIMSAEEEAQLMDYFQSLGGTGGRDRQRVGESTHAHRSTDAGSTCTDEGTEEPGEGTSTCSGQWGRWEWLQDGRKVIHLNRPFIYGLNTCGEPYGTMKGTGGNAQNNSDVGLDGGPHTVHALPTHPLVEILLQRLRDRWWLSKEEEQPAVAARHRYTAVAEKELEIFSSHERPRAHSPSQRHSIDSADGGGCAASPEDENQNDDDPKHPVPAVLDFDQITVNCYPRGAGISRHVDAHASFHDIVLSFSLGSTALIIFRNPEKTDSQEVLLWPRSVMVMSGRARYAWTHGIAKRKTDIFEGRPFQRSLRYSITCRSVKKRKAGTESDGNRRLSFTDTADGGSTNYSRLGKMMGSDVEPSCPRCPEPRLCDLQMFYQQ